MRKGMEESKIRTLGHETCPKFGSFVGAPLGAPSMEVDLKKGRGKQRPYAIGDIQTDHFNDSKYRSASNAAMH